jgi:CheY-like chemotaxis protein
MSRVVSADATPSAPASRSERAIGTSGAPLPRILCVDDEPAILVMLQRALSSEFEVVAVEDPIAALELLEHERFSVIVSDLRMPTMTGTDFLERAKQIAPTSTRLAFTAGLDWQLPPEIAFGVLTKPCPLPLLQATVSAAAQCHALLVTSAASARPPSKAAGDVESMAVATSRLGSHSSGAALAVARPAPSGLRPRELDATTLADASQRGATTSSSLTDVGSALLTGYASTGAGPRRLALALLGSIVELGPRATLLGRALECDIVVRDPRLSPRHLRLFSSWRGVTVQDVSGKGRVRLNGEQLVGARLIEPGDTIELGPFDVYVQSIPG